MKKIFIILCAIIAVTGCGSKKDTIEENKTNNQETNKVETNTESDILNMSFEDAVAYINKLPETNSQYFKIDTSDCSFSKENTPCKENEASIDFYNGTDKIVVIPDEIDGRKIVGINMYAFTNNKDVIAIKLNNSMVYLDDSAFINSSSLEYLTNIGVDKIGSWALRGNLEFVKDPTIFGNSSYKHFAQSNGKCSGKQHTIKYSKTYTNVIKFLNSTYDNGDLMYPESCLLRKEY